MVEQRYRAVREVLDGSPVTEVAAVREVLDGSPVTEVAARYGVSRQSVYFWKRRYEKEGVAGLQEASRRPRTSPSRLVAETEALICELRRAHPKWGARRLRHELAVREVEDVPSRVTIHRALVRNGLVGGQEQHHRRKYRRWQREAPMHLWQMDLVGGIYLAGGRECKMLTGIDDHSRYVVIAAVLAVPSGRAVCEAFAAAMARYGVPLEVLTDNGKQFTGRFTTPRPAEVLFERVCRENGITARLTKPRSPTTTGKIERWHKTLRRELLDEAGEFADITEAQAAIDAWVHAYNHARPHQSLDMATPASRFRPARSESPADHDLGRTAALLAAPAVPAGAPEAAPPARDAADQGTAGSPWPASPDAVELEQLVPVSGQVPVLPRVQRIRLGPQRAGQWVQIWADQRTVHVSLGGHLIKTVPSRLSAGNLQELRMRGARPAGPPPAPPAPAPASALPAGAAIEVDRSVDGAGIALLAGQKVNVGTPLARRKVTLRLDGHLLHVIDDGILARTLPSPIPAGQRAGLRGARIASGPPPPPPAGPVSVQRRVSSDGLIMVTRQRLRIGRLHAGKTVTIHIEDTHFRVVRNGEELSLHARTGNQPATRFTAYKARAASDQTSTMS